MQTFDFIIVGAGSAGCVLADKLSASGQHTVLVLEAGGSDKRLWIQTPIGYGKTFYDAQVNWKFTTEPEPNLQNRRIYVPRGKVLGGSSSINAMVYARGLPHDYMDWQSSSGSAWGWDAVRSVFESFEHKSAAHRPVSNSSNALHVKDVRDQLHPLSAHIRAAAQQADLPLSDDFNGDTPEGVGAYAINTHGGKRWSAADAFLRPALKRANVTLRTHAFVQKIIFKDRTATGVSYEQGGAAHSAQARCAVVLSAGAIQSPQLLQVSGVGDGSLLQSLGIPIVLHNPNVGAHLQDHLAMSYSFRATQPTLNNELNSIWGKLRMGLQYAFARRGVLSLSVNQMGGFVKSSAALAHADMQLYANPITYQLKTDGKKDGGSTQIVPDSFAGFILCFQPCRPMSRGTVRIQSSSMRDAPLIAPNYLSDPRDEEQAIAGAKLIARLAATPAMQSQIASPIAPSLSKMNEADMLADFQTRASTCYHPVGTCSMGLDASTSVVSPQLKAHSLENLYIVDASIFPNVTSGNTHAPTVMVAHMGAKFILESYSSHPSNLSDNSTLHSAPQAS